MLWGSFQEQPVFYRIGIQCDTEWRSIVNCPRSGCVVCTINTYVRNTKNKAGIIDFIQ